ncbi:hypothetical protein K435DRAFT_872527 [Dendrothele bispora CBS 962.96]|uniref:Uncharacterized protein n=1 Tax=Dendrothele bispora (strain CBS 962.96) TaxID=1314807 RepID=A0A4S8L1F7_DENBC|nr:hypothetical protein K435DRAFT_872527 [Dendrothele bispora CBS 962.96]
MPDEETSSSANRVYSVTELVCLIAEMSEYSALTSLAAMSPRGRIIVDMAMRGRITKLMTPYFLHRQAFVDFFILLQITDSIVLGTIPLQAAGLVVSDDRTLIVAVPLVWRPQWHYWAIAFGWVHTRRCESISDAVLCVNSYSLNVSVAEVDRVSSTDECQGWSIFLITSPHKSAVNVVGLFHDTACMNFLTGTRLYIGFPDLTLNYLSSHVIGNRVGWKAGWGILHKFSSSPEWVPGIHCLSIPVSWRISPAVSYLSWSGINRSRRMDFELPVETDEHEITLSTTCPCNSCYCSRITNNSPGIQELVCALHGAWGGMEGRVLDISADGHVFRVRRDEEGTLRVL